MFARFSDLTFRRKKPDKTGEVKTTEERLIRDFHRLRGYKISKMLKINEGYK